MFAIVSVAHIMDGALGLQAPVLRTAVVWFYIANEGLSILENSAEMGLPVPSGLKEALDKLKKKGESTGSVEGNGA